MSAIRYIAPIAAAIAAATGLFWFFGQLFDVWPIDRVILIKDGEMETSSVGRYKDYCWVSWYHGIEHVILLRDGTANDPPFHYRWEPLSHSDRGDPAAFFDRLGCKEPKGSMEAK